MLKQAMAQNGLIAILRGLRPEESVAIGEVLYSAGFRIIEVPLNVGPVGLRLQERRCFDSIVRHAEEMKGFTQCRS